MSDAVFVCVFAITLASLGYWTGFARGETRGRNLQRVEDIQERWRAMPKRDARGRFCKQHADQGQP